MMKSFLHNALIAVGWFLIVGSTLVGVWSLADILAGDQTFLGGPEFVLRSLLTAAVTVGTPIGLGVGLLALADLRSSRD